MSTIIDTEAVQRINSMLWEVAHKNLMMETILTKVTVWFTDLNQEIRTFNNQLFQHHVPDIKTVPLLMILIMIQLVLQSIWEINQLI